MMNLSIGIILLFFFGMLAAQGQNSHPEGSHEGRVGPSGFSVFSGCKSPGPVQNGKVEPSKTLYKPRESVSFVCDKGFALDGIDRRVCRSNGNWSRVQPRCVKKGRSAASSSGRCPKPSSIDNGYVDPDQPSYNSGQIISFICDFQYRRSGPNQRICFNSKWWPPSNTRCIVDFCDEIEAAEPNHGQRNGSNFVGSSFEYSCDQGYILKGSKSITCLATGDWSAAPPDCEDVCSTHKCAPGQKCVFSEEDDAPICVCKLNADCNPDYQPVCGSDGTTYNNDCIMAASACRSRRTITSVSQKICLPGGTCTIHPVSPCRAYHPVFFYNVTAKQCQSMIAGGCHESGWNGFKELQDCVNTCSDSVCLLALDNGPCDARLPKWAYDKTAEKCVLFEYGGCFGNQNNFASEKECQKFCAPQVAFPEPNPTPTPLSQPTCGACAQSPVDVCAALDDLDYVVIATVTSNNKESADLWIRSVVIDIDATLTPYRQATVRKIAHDYTCGCGPFIGDKDIIMGGRYRKGVERVPVIGSGDFVAPFEGLNQFHNCYRL